MGDYRQIAEVYFQKKILPDEVVHHIDGDHTNNAPENLLIMKNAQHSRLHAGVLGALDTWRKSQLKPLCNTCLFVRLFEEFGLNDCRSVGGDLSRYLLSIWTGGTVKPVSVWPCPAHDLLSGLYVKGVEWKRENNHNCYTCEGVAK